MGLISAPTIVCLQSHVALSPLCLPAEAEAPNQGPATGKTNPLLLSVPKRHRQVNDVTRRFRARPTINFMVTNNIGRLCWPPAQLSGHLDFFQNKCGYCKYRSAGLQEISIQLKQHLERFFQKSYCKEPGGMDHLEYASCL